MAGINRDCLLTKFEGEQKITFDQNALGVLTSDIFIRDSSVMLSQLVFTDR